MAEKMYEPFDPRRDRLVAELGFVRARAHLWMGECTEHACHVFLAGFETACDALGVHVYRHQRELAGSKRGWDGPLAEQTKLMRERGLSEEHAIEIDALRLSLPGQPQ
jgi:hypothetical protein